MLPADQAAEPPERGVEDVERRTVPLAPHDALRMGRDELAVAAEDLALVGDEEEGVVDRPGRELGVPLVDSDHDVRAGRPRRAAEGVRRRARDLDRIPLEPRERPFRAGVVPAGGAVDPAGIAGDPGLGEGDELGAVSGRLLDQLDALLDGRVPVEEDRRRLDGGCNEYVRFHGSLLVRVRSLRRRGSHVSRDVRGVSPLRRRARP